MFRLVDRPVYHNSAQAIQELQFYAHLLSHSVKEKKKLKKMIGIILGIVLLLNDNAASMATVTRIRVHATPVTDAFAMPKRSSRRSSHIIQEISLEKTSPSNTDANSPYKHKQTLRAKGRRH